jgi:hypothetical protein
MPRNCIGVFLLCSLPMFASGVASQLSDTPYWYNGDPDGYSDLVNAVNGGSPGNVYDDFVVGTGGITVLGVFSNDVIISQFGVAEPGIITQAQWAIRSGVSTGNGGTIVASGTNAATQTDTHLSGDQFDQTAYTIEVTGLDVTLAPGTYWLTVAPVFTDRTSLSYLSTTAGTNGIGTPTAQDGDSLFNSAFFSINFGTAISQTGGDPGDGNKVDFSEGVEIGTSTPEPATAALCWIAACLLSSRAALRRRCKSISGKSQR